MASGYTRTFVKANGQTINAPDFNTEFQLIDNAFNESTGHKHDGTTDEGAYVPLISGDSNNTSVEINEANDTIDLYVNVLGVKTLVSQIGTDGVIGEAPQDGNQYARQNGNWEIASGSGGSSAAWGTITGTLSNQTDLQAALDGKEDDLGNPASDGYVLSSTTAGVREWIENTGEANLGENLPGSDAEVYAGMNGVNLTFRELAVGSTKLSISQNANNIVYDVVEGNIAHQNLNGAGANTHTQIDAHIAATNNPHNTNYNDLLGVPATFPPSPHTHVLADVTDSGTAASRDVPAVGDAGATEVVLGSDTRLTDARTPVAHTHVEADITDLDKYTQAEVDALLSGLASALDDLTDVTITAVATNEILQYTGAGWENQTLAEAGIATTSELGSYLLLTGGTITGDLGIGGPASFDLDVTGPTGVNVFARFKDGLTGSTQSTLYKNVLIETNEATGGLNFLSIDTAAAGLSWSDASADRGLLVYDHSTDAMSFSTAASAAMLIDSTGRMVIGNTATAVKGLEKGSLTISTGSYGGSAPSGASSDDLIIENNNAAGISILTPSGFNGRIRFGDPGSETAGQIVYDHSLDQMGFSTATVSRFTVDNTLLALTDIDIEMYNSFGGTDSKYMQFDQTTTGLNIVGYNDAQNSFTAWMQLVRSGQELSQFFINQQNVVFQIDTTGRFNMGTTTARGAQAGSLTVSCGDSGSSGAATSADDLIVENNGTGGITILTPNSASGNIQFGDPQDNSAGALTYDHAANDFTIATAGSERVTVSNVGRSTFVGTNSTPIIANRTSSSGTVTMIGGQLDGVACINLRADTAGVFSEIATQNGRALVFSPALSEAARINSSGQMLIGATSPSSTELLRVNGNARVDDVLYVADEGQFGGTITTNSTALYAANIDKNTLWTSCNLTNANASFNANFFDVNCTGTQTLTGDRTVRGIYLDMDSSVSGGDTTNSYRQYGIQADTRCSGDSDQLYGIYAFTEANHTAGTITNLIGNYSFAVGDGTGTITNLYGGFQIGAIDGGVANVVFGMATKADMTANQAATVAAMISCRGEIEIDSTGTLTDGKCFQAILDRNAGTVTTSYLYFGSHQGSNSGTDWGVYIQEDDAINYFAGSVLIGTTERDYMAEVGLHIQNDTYGGGDPSTTASDDLIIENNGGVGMHFLCPNTSNVNIRFGDPDSVNPGQIIYDHTQNEMRFRAGGTTVCEVSSASFRPSSDNNYSLGSSGNRWTTVYATTGTINTSDRRDKQDIEPLSEKEKRIAVRCKDLLRKFRWKENPEKISFGIIAQDLEAEFAREGLDVREYEMFHEEEDEWGYSKLGVRYHELLTFIIAAI